MATKFVANFDVVAIVISVAAIVVLLYYGITVPALASNMWVAYAFWFTGFFGSLFLGITKRTKWLTPKMLLEIVFFTAIILGVFMAVNMFYTTAIEGDILSSLPGKALAASIGVSEELFFGVFLIGLLVNWLRVPPAFAVIVSAGVHTAYHVPNWGANPTLLMLFFLSFAIMRTIYVFVCPYVSILLAGHGIWNFGVE